MNSKIIKHVLLAMLVCISILGTNAQVTIRGTRIPQLSTSQRNTISAIDANTAKGQAVYNTDNNCFEYWNGIKWVSLCIGRANISLNNSCGDSYDAAHPPVAAAEGEDVEGCMYMPIDNDNACIVPGGQAYQVYLTAGANYASLFVDEVTSEFSISFSPNNSVNSRVAVVRVINNCSGEFEDFMFVQEGAECPDNLKAFTVSSENTTVCGKYGAVIAYIEKPQEGIDYLWEYGGVIMHTGNFFEITRAGTYTVYAGLIGCQKPQPQQLTIVRNLDDISTPVVTVSNQGIICSGNDVVLTAQNDSGANVKWFHNGIIYEEGAGKAILTVSGSSAAGEWFAIQQKGDCSSKASNKVTLIDKTASVPLAAPVALVNDQALSSNLVICKGGSLELNVGNSYPDGTVFEWFGNGQSIGQTTGILMYTVSAEETSLQLSVQVSNNTGSCPVTATGNPTAVTFVAPEAAIINNGVSTACICDNNGVALSAMNMTGIYHQWFLDDKVIIGDSTLIIFVKNDGLYTMRLKDNKGCWSPVSNTVKVETNSMISLAWFKEPSDKVLVNNGESYSVLSIPNADSYKWISSDTTIAKVTPTGDGRSVNVDYTANNIDGWSVVNIKVEASNACGTVLLDKDVDVVDGCDSLSSLYLIPEGIVVKMINEDGKPKTNRDSTTVFYAEIAQSSSVKTYLWYENGVLKQEGAEPYFIYVTPQATGDYEISVTAVNGCNVDHDSTTSVSNALVRVIGNIPEDSSGNFILSGKTCLDVKRSNDNMTCMPLASRVDYFANTKTFTYKFNKIFPNSTYTDLIFAAYDPYVLLKNAVTWNDNIATLTFRDDINDYVKGVTKNDARIIILIAQYKVGDESKQVSIEISVQDCSCGCAVKSTLPSGWITFLCYNLGADENKTTVNEQMNYSSTVVTDPTVYGDLYQWGRRKDGHQLRKSELNAGPMVDRNLDKDGQVAAGVRYGKYIFNGAYPYDWRTPQSDALWGVPKTVGDPCPEGWRVPVDTEWMSVFEGNNLAVTVPDVNGKKMTASGNFVKWNPNNTKGWMISPNDGADFTMFLPAAGYRNLGSDGAIISASYEGDYWTSSTYPIYPTLKASYRLQLFSTRINPVSSNNAYRAYGASVRCVRDE
jgi:uncharacterized protein (TIGR02145 family)